MKLSSLFALGGVFFVVLACQPEASKDASLPCAHDRECTRGHRCLPARNGATDKCISPACSHTCNTDNDCKAMRLSAEGEECFVCRDVAGCPQANTEDAGSPLKVCIDRCVRE